MDFDVFPDVLGKTAGDLLGKLVVVLVILVATGLARRLVWKEIPRLVRFLGTRTHSTFDEQLVLVLQGPARFLVGVLGMWLAISALGLHHRYSTIIDLLMASLVTLSIFWVVYRTVDLAAQILRSTIRRSSRRPVTALEEKLVQFIQKVAKGIVVVFAIVMVLDRWGYNVGGLLAGLGLGGLAVALAAQDALANLIGYFLIVADEPFLIGDYVALDGATAGTVGSLGFRSTRLRQPDQSLVIVPNKTIVGANIVNWSRLTKRRLDMTLSLSTKSAIEQVLAVIQAVREMLQTHAQVQSDSVLVQFSEFGDHSLNVRIVCFMKTPAWNDFQAARQDINLKIMRVLSERGVDLSSPTYEILVGKVEAPSPKAGRVFPPPVPEPVNSPIADSPVPDDAAN